MVKPPECHLVLPNNGKYIIGIRSIAELSRCLDTHRQRISADVKPSGLTHSLYREGVDDIRAQIVYSSAINLRPAPQQPMVFRLDTPSLFTWVTVDDVTVFYRHDAAAGKVLTHVLIAIQKETCSPGQESLRLSADLINWLIQCRDGLALRLIAQPRIALKDIGCS